MKEQRKNFDERRDKARRGSRIFFTTQLAASVLTPVLIGSSTFASFEWLRVPALATSAVALFGASMLNYFAFRERYQSYSRVSGSIQALQLEADLLASKATLTEAEVETLRSKFQEELNNGNKRWNELTRKAAKTVGA